MDTASPAAPFPEGTAHHAFVAHLWETGCSPEDCSLEELYDECIAWHVKVTKQESERIYDRAIRIATKVHQKYRLPLLARDV